MVLFRFWGVYDQNIEENNFQCPTQDKKIIENIENFQIQFFQKGLDERF